MDLLAQIASLKNDYGSSKGPNAAASFHAELWMGHPDNGGAQVPASTDVEDETTGDITPTANGYVAATVTNDGAHFPAPDPDSGVLTTAALSWPTSTAEYPDTASHVVLRDAATGAVWQVSELDEPIDVNAAGVTPATTLDIFYDVTAA